MLEQNEDFKVHLKEVTGLNQRITIVQSVGTVTIIDDGENQANSRTTLRDILSFYLLVEAVIGLEIAESVVDEDVGEIAVCVVVFSPQLDCPVLFPFDVHILTTPGTAGNMQRMS